MSELRRILCVEDEPDIQAVVRIALESVGGFEVALCDRGAEAPALAAAFAPDLILLDVMMPGMDGPSTLAALRAEPALAATPVVFLTARALGEARDHYRALGALGVISKPFDPMTLAARIRELWARYNG